MTDAWHPQVNGVVRTLESLRAALQALGHEVRIASPEGRASMALPTYPDIRLTLFPRRGLERLIRDFAPDAIHIATEGTMGLSARAICLRQGRSFTTAFHTRFADYVRLRLPWMPLSWLYRLLRWFHDPAHAVLVPTRSLMRELEGWGMRSMQLWSRGVDSAHFRPQPGASLPFARPIWLNVGRVAVEKNLEAFLRLDLPGTKVVVGDGPHRAALEKAYPAARFMGLLDGADLVSAYSAADVFVFPSRTDTFGLVLLEALACGTPVATYPVQGPLDVIGQAQPPVGVLDEDLGKACLQALRLDRGAARAFAKSQAWQSVAQQFLDYHLALSSEDGATRPEPTP